jgi:hypothetical protein
VLAPLASPISLPGAASSQPPLSVGVGMARFAVLHPSGILHSMHRFGSAVADQPTETNQQLLGSSSAVTPPASGDGLVASMCRFGSALAKAAPSALGDGSVQFGRMKEVPTEDPGLILASFPVPPTKPLSAEGFTASASTYMHVGEQDTDMADVKYKATSSRVKAVVTSRLSKNKAVRRSKYSSSALNVTPDKVKPSKKKIPKSLQPNDAPAEIEPMTDVPEALQPIDPPTETYQIESPAEIAVDWADVTEAHQPIDSPAKTRQVESPAEIVVDWVVTLHKADVPEDLQPIIPPTEIEANYLDAVAPHHTDVPVDVLPDEDNILPPSELEVGSVPLQKEDLHSSQAELVLSSLKPAEKGDTPSVFQNSRKREFIYLLENDGMEASLRKTYHDEPVKKQNKISHPNLAFDAGLLTGRAAGTSPEAVDNIQQESDIYLDAIMNAYETQDEQSQLGETSSALGHLENPQADEQDGIEPLSDNTSANEVIEPRRSQRVVVKNGKFGRSLG